MNVNDLLFLLGTAVAVIAVGGIVVGLLDFLYWDD